MGWKPQTEGFPYEAAACEDKQTRVVRVVMDKKEASVIRAREWRGRAGVSLCVYNKKEKEAIFKAERETNKKTHGCSRSNCCDTWLAQSVDS